MPAIKQGDGHGHSITLLDTDGYRTSVFGGADDAMARIRQMPSFKCRPDDVFVCAPVKSGTHWTWEIVSMLYQGNAETIPKSKLDNMLEGTPWDTLEALKSPRVLNTHSPYKMLPKEAKEMGCKILYVLRNPKDMAVSLYNHDVGIALYEYDVECNSWFKYVREWEEEMARHPALPIQLLYFEDLKEDILQEVYKIGRFLNVENKDGLFEAVSEKCQFHNMVIDKQQYLGPEGLEFRNGYSFFRKGEVGEWKNWFTVAQNEVFDQVYNEQMKNSKHKFKFTLTETSHTSV